MTDLVVLSRLAEARDGLVRQLRVVQPGWDVLAPDAPPSPTEAPAILLDCRDAILFGQQAIQLLRPPHASQPGPFVIAILDNTEAAKAWAVKAGIDDVLLDPFSLLDLQLRTVAARRALAQRDEIDRLALVAATVERQAAHYRTLAYTDHLTGLPNRLFLDKWVADGMGRRDGPERFAVQMLDLNGFKQVNDRHGHEVGDRLLRQVGARVAGVSRRPDLVVRLGGDEIAIVQIGAVGPEDCAALALRLSQAFEAPFEVDGISLRLGISIGSALYPTDSDSFAELLRRADSEMYAAKPARDRQAALRDGRDPDR